MQFNKTLLSIILLISSAIAYSQENCNNGIDDDGDGMIDLNDSECICNGSTVTSFVNNPNLEQMNFCPNEWAQFNAASGWFTPSSATSDYINSCGFVPASTAASGIYPLPPSNGNGVAGILVSRDYKEYIATCTNTTLQAGTKYQLNFDIASSNSGRSLGNDNIGMVCNDNILNAGRINIAVYGRSDCNTTAPENTNFFPGMWQRLGTVNYLPTKNWGQLSIIFTPTTNINSIMIGAESPTPVYYLNEIDYKSCFPYFYFDNIILNTASNLGLHIAPTGSFCENSLQLKAILESTQPSSPSYQWYKDGIAIVGATNNILPIGYNLSNTGNYQVKISYGSSCKISPKYNVNTVIDLPEYSIDQSPCFPGYATFTITTPADEYSFDNGLTWSTSPSMGNISPPFSPIKLLIKKNGCISSARYAVLNYSSLETIAEPELLVVPPGCQTNGSIKVITPAEAYSFDDGVTWTTNPLLENLPPNYYHIYKVKIKTLLGCISNARYTVMYPFVFPEPTFTFTMPSCGIDGTITITTPAYEYSIDGGTTWSTNPVFTNLPVGFYNIKTRNELNCTSVSAGIEMHMYYLPKPQVSFTQPSCGTLGSIRVLTEASEYSFDNGDTWTTSNIASNLSGGIYQIKIKNAQNCISYSEIVFLNTYVWNVNVNYTVQNAFCSANGSISITTNAQEYSFDGGITWTTNPTVTNLSPGYYPIQIRNGVNCESNTIYVNLIDAGNTPPNYQIVNAGCNTYGSVTITQTADLYSFDNGITWSTNNSISNLSGNHTFVLLIKIGSCISDPITVNFNSQHFTNPSVNDYEAKVCDLQNNKIEKVNLPTYNSYLVSNPTTYEFHYFRTLSDAQNLNLINEIHDYTSHEISSANSTVFVSIQSSANCHSVSKITFTFLDVPVITTIPNTVIVCENSSVIVNGGNFFDNYLWSTGATTSSIRISEPGNYSLTASYDYSNQICSTTKEFSVVLSNVASITSILTEDFTDNDNVIIINVTGFGNYEFSIDGTNYQASNIFSGLANGIYTVYVKDKNGCGLIKEDVFLLMYPKFFTPNGDGHNDYWSIKLSNFEPGLEVVIFDRYGKLIKKLGHNSSWDGKHNGKDLPSDDYWFVITKTDGKGYRGHFALKR